MVDNRENIQVVKVSKDTNNTKKRNRILVKGNQSIKAIQRQLRMEKSIINNRRAVRKSLKSILRNSRKNLKSSLNSSQRIDGSMEVKALETFRTSKIRNINNRINNNNKDKMSNRKSLSKTGCINHLKIRIL